MNYDNIIARINLFSEENHIPKDFGEWLKKNIRNELEIENWETSIHIDCFPSWEPHDYINIEWTILNDKDPDNIINLHTFILTIFCTNKLGEVFFIEDENKLNEKITSEDIDLNDNNSWKTVIKYINKLKKINKKESEV